MLEEKFNSDFNRTGKLSKHVKFFEFNGLFHLSSGEKLDGLKLAYETYGELNKEKSNAILVCHAISGDSHVAKHEKEDIPGWWDIMVGPGKSIDTSKYRRSSEIYEASEDLLNEIRTSKPAKGFNKVEIPGERERLNRKNSNGNIKVPEKTWKQILELHKSL